VGVGANPAAPDLEREFARFRYKVEAGAQWAMTQPVFDCESLFRFLDFAGKFAVPVVAGIWPLTSLRNAEFMANEVPGVFVPERVLERMRKRRTAEEQREEGLALAAKLMEQVQPHVQGVQISAPGNNVEHALRLVRGR
jgi:homocysteine S-methyltransferase